MARLEELTAGARVNGILKGQAVEILSARWYGSLALTIVYQDSKGNTGSETLYRDREAELSLAEKSLLWSFDADGRDVRLASEARRIQLAHLFDPYLAVHTSSVEPLPHQISAVYGEMLPRLPLRYILADDPGAGKTIMTGLLVKELIVRGDLKRCLIVSPGSLTEQWQEELHSRFGLRFEILTNDRAETAVTGNVFLEVPLCIARLDMLSRNQNLQEKLKATDWDLIVVDEAHKMSASAFGGEIHYTRRFQLGRLLSRITRHFLLLTATPHNGKPKDFQLFLSLIDQDRFEGAAHTGNRTIQTSDIMRRLVKEDLLKFDGTPLFPERRAYTVNYDLSPAEARLYSMVTEYVRQEFNRADHLSGERRNTVGFALTILQRRLASSPEAIWQSLRRRRERLEERLAEEKLKKRSGILSPEEISLDEDCDEDDLPESEMEELEEDVADRASASSTIPELEAEIATLRRLEEFAQSVRASGQDRKWDELSRLLQDDSRLFRADGQRKKLIIFTEHRDTLQYLARRIRNLFGTEESVAVIHGGMLREERRKAEQRFREDKEVRILVATDAAGEGINLQRAHLMVNYDLPWNPNRLEQRFGRIHRIGQTEVCHLWNLVSKETREGMVFQRLFEKLEEERSALGGKVFDVLGKVSFDNRPLRDLLIEAIRYGKDPDVQNRLWKVVDDSLDRTHLQDLLEERALTQDSMDVSKVMRIREEMERAEAHRLQPHFIASFFLEAFPRLGGRIYRREGNRYEITSVPFPVRQRDMQLSTGEAVMPRYERVCFEKEDRFVQGLTPATLICPGHPLLEAVLNLTWERLQDAMRRGAIFIDEDDYGTEARLLFYMESSLQDGVILPDGKRRLISRQVRFVELKESGAACNGGYAPYLDYRPCEKDEYEAIRAWLPTQAWLTQDVERIATDYAIRHILPEHLSEVGKKRQELVDRTLKQVQKRMHAEIQYWDCEAMRLRELENAGKKPRHSSAVAHRRADDLSDRLERREEELARERVVSSLPPVITGGSLVIPKGLLRRLMGGSLAPAKTGDRQAIEYAAMNAVMNIERALGYLPKDVSADKKGYDIESAIPEERQDGTGSLRFIEVKGRVKGAKTVTVSRNEILTALNKEETFYLAVVEVDGNHTRTVYLRHPFRTSPDFTIASINYKLEDLYTSSEIVYEE